jgi:predicted pyridoxine 5'-phosphate oxidase superfamily flavin-nucleotide-binding protein
VYGFGTIRLYAKPALAIAGPRRDTRRVTDLYHRGARELQDRFDTRRLADRLEQVKVHGAITAEDRAFIERMDMFFLATADAEGRPQCSYKGGDPGFVAVLDEQTVAFPNYDGNGMYLSIGNLRVNPHVGLLFIDFGGRPPRRLRLNGVARVEAEDPLLARFPGAQFVVRVRAVQVFPNCPRYIHRMEVVERSPFVPRAHQETPVPEWKRADWARDALPTHDPAGA